MQTKPVHTYVAATSFVESSMMMNEYDHLNFHASLAGPVSATATEKTTSSTTKEPSAERECILFPTYAVRDPEDPSGWLIRAKGWALSHHISPAKQKIAMGVTRNFLGSTAINNTSSTDHSSTSSSDLFHQRFKYFLAKNKPNKQFVIHVVGSTTMSSSLDELDGYVDHYSLPNHNENTSTQAQSESGASAAAEAMLPYFQNDVLLETLRRNSVGSTDSGFHSSLDEAQKITEFKYDIYFNHFEDIVPFLAYRPGNPLSTILDGGRAKIQSCRVEAQQQQQYATTHNNNDSSSCNVDIPDFFQNSNDATATTNLSSDGSSSSIYYIPLSRYSVPVKSDSRGFITGQITVPQSQVCAWANERDHCDGRVIHLESESSTFQSSAGLVTLVEPTGISIISDIDDTIKHTQILAGPKTVLTNTFFKHFQQVPNMAEAYTRWYTQGASFHYVSNSPFQLMPMLQGFLKKCDFPPGSMHLRVDGSLFARLIEVPGRAKRDAITQILNDFPHRKFVLIGDSGEIDLEIYARIAADFPGRIIKIMIRDVSIKKSSSSTTMPETNLIRRSTSFFLKKQKQQPQQQSLAELVSVSTPFQVRVLKAKQMCNTDIVVFEDAKVLKDDRDIRDALWRSLDEQSSP